VNKHITFRNDSGARKELISPYNFLPFYLPEVYKDIDRFIYLDSDIVVKV
jgi:lipopolysaccharide biosynthesis glycosyltransferase